MDLRYSIGFRTILLPSIFLALLSSACGAVPAEEEALGEAKQAMGLGGFVVISGDDADDAGHCQGTTCGGAYAAFVYKAVTESKSGGKGILAIGVNGGQAQFALYGWNNPANGGPNALINFANTPAEIASASFADYASIYIPSSAAQTTGGITDRQLAALNARKADIVTYVNVQGGSLVALTEAEATDAWGWLPLPLTTADENFIPVAPTSDLLTIAPGATAANLSHRFYHNVFTGPENYSGLHVLATHDAGGAYQGLPVILGGFGTILTAELCADGIDNDDDGAIDNADVDCQICGDGDATDPGEQCDDGNMTDGDGCSSTCQTENHAPVAVCIDVTTCNDLGQCSAGVAPSTLAGGSSDPDGNPISYASAPPSNYDVGTTQVTLTVSDGQLEACCTSTVQVNDCETPVITCPDEQVVECTGDSQAFVTPGDASATDNCNAPTIVGPSAGSYPLGTTDVTYTATDAAGNSASCGARITVVDTIAPVVIVEQSPVASAQNHEYARVRLSDCGIVVVDPCGGTLDLAAASAAITSVTSDELEDAPRDGNARADMVIVNDDTVDLRAPRHGAGDGRVYEIHFRVRDGSGNAATGTCHVTVPHSQNGASAVDSGDAYRIDAQ